MFEIFKAGRPVLLGLLLAFSAGTLQIAHADERYREHEYFDPTLSAGASPQKHTDYQRALGACLEGRGYTVR